MMTPNISAMPDFCEAPKSLRRLDAKDVIRPWFSSRKVGGLRFVRIGRLSFSYCITRK